jgi:hypothetical protein
MGGIRKSVGFLTSILPDLKENLSFISSPTEGMFLAQ